MTREGRAAASPSAAARRERRQWLLLALNLALFAALMAVELLDERGRVQEREGERLAAQARLIERNLSQNLASVRGALEVLRADLAAYGGKGRLPEFTLQKMHALAGVLPGVRTMVVLDAEGIVRASNRDELLGRNLSEREYFRRAKDARDPATMVLSPPFKTVLDAYSMNLALPVLRAGVGFAGVVAATLDPGAFRTLLDSVRSTPDMSAAIAHQDGLLFLMTPERPGLPDTDLSRVGSLFSRHRDTGQVESVLTGTMYTTGEARMAAQRTLNPAPLGLDRTGVILVSSLEAQTLAQWRRDAAGGRG